MKSFATAIEHAPMIPVGFFLRWIVGGVLSLGFMIGCSALEPILVSEEPQLISSAESGDEEDLEYTGKQQASIELTTQAKDRIMTGDTDEAISILQKAISLYPSNPYAYYYLAKSRYLQGRYVQTFPSLGKAELYLEEDEDDWLSWVYDLRGRAYEGLVRLDEAREQYELALLKNPGNLDAQAGMLRLSPTMN